MNRFLKLSILFAFSVAPASAQGTAQQRASCTDDAYRLCEAQIPDESAVEQCLRAHMGALSRDCRQEFGGPAKKGKQRRRPR